MQTRERTVDSEVIRLQPAFDDPERIRSLVQEAGPFAALALTAQTKQERERSGKVLVSFVPPWFRRDLATHGEVHSPGGEEVLFHTGYCDAAARVYRGAEIVDPTTVYVNVMGPVRYPFAPHLDIPVFVHASRRNCPVWLLFAMFCSGLFVEQRVRLATAVTWFFDGPGGAFHYWPEGPTGPMKSEEPPFDNVAVVADNEALYHGVGPLGSVVDESAAPLSVDATIHHESDTGRWRILDPDPVVEYEPSDVRITISWKAEVFSSEQEQAARRELFDAPLPIDDIVARLVDDMRTRGLNPVIPDDPLHDPEWIDLVQSAYPLAPPPVIPRSG
ncbi:MAG: hypothetical protein F4Y27_13375 [Acidimicrobiaceae bacterium]|nr:hypothetical protein [Acidimicrobiaceae bacterium]MYG55673.1 hypothetical protein [Acidimicrobiaceae bacterium]MYJ98329.1 hypothetical protein [Acidimicrobiaceae bacterium]